MTASFETRLATQLAISGGTLGAYLIFYSGYSKKTKGLELAKQLGPILSFKSTTFSLRELNKIFALAGMTLAGASLLCNDQTTAVSAALQPAAAAPPAESLAEAHQRPARPSSVLLAHARAVLQVTPCRPALGIRRRTGPGPSCVCGHAARDALFV